MSGDEPTGGGRPGEEVEEPLPLHGPAVPRWMAAAALLALVASGLLTAWLILSR